MVLHTPAVACCGLLWLFRCHTHSFYALGARVSHSDEIRGHTTTVCSTPRGAGARRRADPFLKFLYTVVTRRRTEICLCCVVCLCDTLTALWGRTTGTSNRHRHRHGHRDPARAPAPAVVRSVGVVALTLYIYLLDGTWVLDVVPYGSVFTVTVIGILYH